MLKKSAIVAVLSGAAILSGGAIAASADTLEAPTPSGTQSSNSGNNLCPAPWQWNGPATVGMSGESTSYAACNGSGVEASEGGYGNNFCPAPWQWNGPFNAMHTDNQTSYAACNG